MWANNEVGTVQPVAELAAVARELRRAVPHRRGPGRRPGAGRLRRPAACDALTVTGHKLGGPIGVGALLLRRDVDPTPLLHGGGQERDVRSGTLDAPAIAGVRRRGRGRRQRAQPSASQRARRAARRPGRRRPRRGARRRAQRRPRPGAGPPAARQRALLLPRLRGRLAAAAARRPGHRTARTGSACSAGVAQPSHVLLAMGADRRQARVVAALLARPHLDRGRRRRAASPRCGPRSVERARRAAGLRARQVG